MIFDRRGDLRQSLHSEHGFFHRGTRHLAGLELFLNGSRPKLLSSAIKENNVLLTVDLANIGGPDHPEADSLHLFRSRFLTPGVLQEKIRCTNYGTVEAPAEIALRLSADFADIFEVRGIPRQARGETKAAVAGNREILLRYSGRDGVERRTRLYFSPPPDLILKDRVLFRLEIPPQGATTVSFCILCETGDEQRRPEDWESALERTESSLRKALARDADIYTANELFNDWLRVSRNDLHTLFTETRDGPYPYAGIPWFSAPFGRDGILTALAYLWINPAPARAVLSFLARTQALEDDPSVDAEPGKILHEARSGEMVATGEIPYARYYGSADATPLFVILAGEYFKRTRDCETLETIRPAFERALEWIARYGDRDGDGFVEYLRRSPNGLRNHAWKDSCEAYFHENGDLAEGPIAPCEVQGYVFAARKAAATLFRAWNEPERAEAEEEKAEALRRQFEEVFWDEALGMYVLGLDGEKRPLRLRTSNPGHLLWTGIVSRARAETVAESLFQNDLFSGWGIRTLSSRSPRYNPLSYHNGSVWPHDNAVIAAGFARYGLHDKVLRLLTALFDASLYVEDRRMPELFCGFPRRPEQGPTLYPVACSPQAWAAAVAFWLLQSTIGIELDAHRRHVLLNRPLLPPFLERVEIRNLTLPEARVDLLLERHPNDVGVKVLRREGDVEIVVVK